MKLKELTKQELETMSYDEIAYLILDNAGKKMKLLDLFQKVCKILELPESIVEDKISEFFELLSTNKKFIQLPKGYWDLATKHVQNIVVEDEEDVLSEDVIEDEEIDEMEQEDEEDIFYDNELDDDEEEDDLKDLVIIDEEEMM